MQTIFTKGTSKQFRLDTVKSVFNNKVKIAIRNSSPVSGKIVCLEDCTSLLNKDMVRFVSDRKLDWFEGDNCNPVYTRILNINLFEIITTI